MRIKGFILIIFMLFICQLKVNATNMSMDLSCPSTVYKNESFSCNININALNGLVNGVTFNYSFENATFKTFTQSDGWSPYSDVNSSSGISLGNINGVSGNNFIGKVAFVATGNIGSSIKIGIINIDGSDTDYNSITSSNIFKTINIIEKTTTTTTRPANNTTTTTKPITTQPPTTTQAITTSVDNNILLDSLSIEGINFDFDRNIFEYEISVGKDVKYLNINATTAKNNTISGIGKIDITNGENIIVITVSDNNDKKKTATYTLKVLKKNNIVSNNKDEIMKAFETNDELIVNLNDKDINIVDKDIINIIKENDKKIIYNIYNDDEVLYYYEFNGNKISDDYYNEINLKVNFNENDIINKNIKDNKKISFENEHKGFFPDGTTLNIRNITDMKEDKIKLYKLNVESNLELINNNVMKSQNNYYSFEIEKGSKYVLSSKSKKEYKFNIILIVCFVAIFVEVLIIGFFLSLLFRNKVKRI